MESVATNKRHCKAELRAALQRALSALDFEENIHTTDSSLNKCCRDYEAASRHVETALRSGTLSILKQSTVLSKWSGESEKIIKGLFDLSRKIRPAIIFLDEIDAFGLGRSANNEISSRRILTELLVHVIGATNRLQDLDEALRRRFELTIEVPLPSQNSRKMIFQFYMKQANTELPCEELRYISEMTEGYSASDLKALCRVAAMRPVRELIQSLDMEQFSSSELSSIKQKMRRIDINDFQEALSQYKAARCIENGQ